MVDDIGGATALTGVGDDQFVLLARVRFDPTGADAAAVDEATHVIGPYPLGLGLTDGRASLTGAGAIAPTLGGAPATAMWGVVYDINDSESINLTDYNAFRATFNQPVDDTTPDTGAVHLVGGFSKSGATVNLTDYNLFRGNFNKSRLGGQPLVLPANFPTAWVPAPWARRQPRPCSRRRPRPGRSSTWSWWRSRRRPRPSTRWRRCRCR